MSERTGKLFGPDDQFPVDVVAYDFASDMASGRLGRTRFKFSLRTVNAITALRRLADGIESGIYLLQAVETSQKAILEDFTMSAITITYAEKKVAPALVETSLADERTTPSEDATLTGQHQFPNAVKKTEENAT